MPFAELGTAQPVGWSEWLRRFSPEYTLPPAGSMPQYPGLRQAQPMGPMEFFFTHQPVWEAATRVPPMKSWPGIIPGPPASTPEDKLMEFATMMTGPVFGLAARPAAVPEMPLASQPFRPFEQTFNILRSETGAVGPKKPVSTYDPLTGRRTVSEPERPRTQRVDPLLGRRPREEQPAPSYQPAAVPQPPAKLMPQDQAELSRLREQWRNSDRLSVQEQIKLADQIGDWSQRTGRRAAEVVAGFTPRRTTSNLMIESESVPTPGALYDPLAGLSPQDAAAIQQKLVGGQSAVTTISVKEKAELEAMKQRLRTVNMYGDELHQFMRRLHFLEDLEAGKGQVPPSNPVPAFPSSVEQQSGLAGAFGPREETSRPTYQQFPGTPGEDFHQVPELQEFMDRFLGHPRRVFEYPALSQHTTQTLETALNNLARRVSSTPNTPPQPGEIAAVIADEALRWHPEWDWSDVYNQVRGDVLKVLEPSGTGSKR